MKILLHNGRIKIKYGDESFEKKCWMFLVYISPVVDLVTGALKLSGYIDGISLSTILKICMLVVFIFFIFNKNEKNEIFLFMGVGLYFMIVPLFYVLLDQGQSSLVNDYTQITKILLPMSMILSYQNLERNEKIKLSDINNIVNFYSWFLPLSLLIPYFLKIGYSTYSANVGYKGFYFAGNDITISMVCITAISLSKMLHEKRILNLLKFLIGLVATLLLGTKTSFISILLFVAICFVYAKNIKKLVINTFLGLISLVIVLRAIFIFQYEFFQKIMDKFLYNYYVRTQSDILMFLSSSRILRIQPVIEEGIKNNSMGILGFIFGLGSNKVSKILASAGISVGIIEMDLLDLFFSYGLIGCLLIIIFYYKIWKKRNAGLNDWYLIFIFCILFGIMAGHVLFSAMSGILLSILCINLIGKRSEK